MLLIFHIHEGTGFMCKVRNYLTALYSIYFLIGSHCLYAENSFGRLFTTDSQRESLDDRRGGKQADASTLSTSTAVENRLHYQGVIFSENNKTNFFNQTDNQRIYINENVYQRPNQVYLYDKENDSAFKVKPGQYYSLDQKAQYEYFDISESSK